MPDIFGTSISAGGSGQAFAAIGAIYPAGATCTCSYGGKTITAKDTSGRALFLVPSAGQWLVKASNGGQEVEDTVSITTKGQVASVTLAFFTATIAVTYPSGSTCTCSDGTTTLTASDTSGSYTFTVPNTGTWTVTATDGDKTKSITVSITADGQSESVTLSYADYIFKAGTGAVKAMTTSSGANQTITIGTSSIVWSWNGTSGYSACVAYTKDKIDLTNYKNLCVRSTMTSLSVESEQFRAKLGITSSTPNMNAAISAWAAYGALNTNTNATLTIDISAISGSYYIALQGAAANGDVFDIWLE